MAVQSHRLVARVRIGLTASMLSGNLKKQDLKFKTVERAMKGIGGDGC